MTSEPQIVPKLPLRFLEYQPLAFFVGWLLAVGIVSDGIIENIPLEVSAHGAKPFGAVVIGLIAGLVMVAGESWRVRRRFDATVRAAVSGALDWRSRLLLGIVVLGTLWAGILADHFVLGLARADFSLLTLGCWLLPCPLMYHAYRPVFERAAQLWVETSAGATVAPAISARGSRRVGIWLDIIVALSIAGALAAGAWLQWAAPRMVPT